MKKSALLSALSIGVLSISMAFATPAQAVSQVRSNATEVLNILQKANGSNDAAVRRQAETYAMPYFDFQRMTALAMGRDWNKASPEQKTRLSEEFKTLLV
ncbi:MAG TPA: ABC transporter substrate-binding protein, partial [Neisseria sp.]|nr:ABC transporter substrate-binding protein [Neisseria sp.]